MEEWQSYRTRRIALVGYMILPTLLVLSPLRSVHGSVQLLRFVHFSILSAFTAWWEDMDSSR